VFPSPGLNTVNACPLTLEGPPTVGITLYFGVSPDELAIDLGAWYTAAPGRAITGSYSGTCTFDTLDFEVEDRLCDPPIQEGLRKQDLPFRKTDSVSGTDNCREPPRISDRLLVENSLLLHLAMSAAGDTIPIIVACKSISGSRVEVAFDLRLSSTFHALQE